MINKVANTEAGAKKIETTVFGTVSGEERVEIKVDSMLCTFNK